MAGTRLRNSDVLSFCQSFVGKVWWKWIIKILTRLNEGDLRFIDLKKLKLLKKWCVHVHNFNFRCQFKPSPVPELSFLPAPYRGWTRASERRVQDNLHAHAHNEPIKDYQVPTKLLASMCRAMPFSARALKENIFFDVDIVIKNILYSYRQRVRVITLFPNIFFVFFLYV